MYVAGCWVAGRAWRTRARLFAALLPERGRRLARLRFSTVQLGSFTRYDSCVIWTAYENGLCAVPWIFLRLGHPPLFLPWEKISYRVVSRHFFQTGVEFLLPGAGSVWIPLRDARRLRRRCRGLWPGATVRLDGRSDGRSGLCVRVEFPKYSDHIFFKDCS